MSDVLALLVFPCLAAIVFVGMHTWLGLQVLRRNVVFADLALAQLSALGATLALVVGHAPGGPAAFGYALLFTIVGAVLLTVTRRFSGQVSQEAMIGIVYVVATAVTILVIDRSPQGAEHVKRMLVGSILTIGPMDILKLALLYGGIGAMHGLCRKPLLAASENGAGAGPWTALWDLVFYISFGLVVTSSVGQAGVLLVFSFLIIPAVIGTLFSPNIGAALLVGWGAGMLASLLGLAGSLAFDLPTGAAMVAAFAVILGLAVLLRPVLSGSASKKAARRAAFFVAAAMALAVLAQAGWLIAAPGADQPLLAAFEAISGLGPERFMTPGERSTYAEAGASELRHRADVDRLREMERIARWQGEGLNEEQLRRVASFQQSYAEMGRGERFVQDHLRSLARSRERWYVGIPALAASGLILLILVRPIRRQPVG